VNNPPIVPRSNRKATCASKQKKHGLETWELFIGLIKAFETVPKEVLFTMLRWFGLPDDSFKVLLRLHFGAKAKV
jgi:hypothetical protein